MREIKREMWAVMWAVYVTFHPCDLSPIMCHLCDYKTSIFRIKMRRLIVCVCGTVEEGGGGGGDTCGVRRFESHQHLPS